MPGKGLVHKSASLCSKQIFDRLSVVLGDKLREAIQKIYYQGLSRRKIINPGILYNSLYALGDAVFNSSFGFGSKVGIGNSL